MDNVVFRDYDQKGLNYEYDNRGRFPDTADCKAAQVAGSDEAKIEYECRLDVRFGTEDTDLLDIYLSKEKGPNPIHVFWIFEIRLTLIFHTNLSTFLYKNVLKFV